MDATDARSIVAGICRREGVELGRVLDHGGRRSFARVRRLAIAELRTRGATFAVIGRVLGRDRSTVRRILMRAAVATAPAAPAP